MHLLLWGSNFSCTWCNENIRNTSCLFCSWKTIHCSKYESKKPNCNWSNRSTWCRTVWPENVCGTKNTPFALSWPNRMTSCPRGTKLKLRRRKSLLQVKGLKGSWVVRRPRDPQTLSCTCSGEQEERRKNGSGGCCWPPGSRLRSGNPLACLHVRLVLEWMLSIEHDAAYYVTFVTC